MCKKVLEDIAALPCIGRSDKKIELGYCSRKRNDYSFD